MTEIFFLLILHELYHVILGHTRLFSRVSPIDNIVFDAVINSMLCPPVGTDRGHKALHPDQRLRFAAQAPVAPAAGLAG